MSRIRTIKPEFWTSEQIMECSTNARLLFIGLWNFCDDAGRHPLAPKRVKAEIFPADDFTADDVRRMIDELESKGLIVTYTVDDIEYLAVTGWHHQKIDKPQKPKYPGPDDAHSSNVRRPFAAEGKGREGKGEERAAQQSSTPPREPEPSARKAELDRLEARLRQAAGLEDDPSPSLYDTSPIHALIGKGYDIDRDILPVLKAAAASGKRGRTWRYYVPGIEAAKAGNDAIRSPPAGNGNGTKQAIDWDMAVRDYERLAGEFFEGNGPGQWGYRHDLRPEVAARFDAVDERLEQARKARFAGHADNSSVTRGEAEI